MSCHKGRCSSSQRSKLPAPSGGPSESFGQLRNSISLALCKARLKGLEEQRRLLREAGGAVGATEAAQILGISRQAVDARRKKGRLLSVAAGRRGWRYPMAQFDGTSEDGVVRGLERVLAAIDDEGGWMRLAFLLSPEERLGGERPLDALRRGEVEAVEQAARLYGKHGAY